MSETRFVCKNIAYLHLKEEDNSLFFIDPSPEIVMTPQAILAKTQNK